MDFASSQVHTPSRTSVVYRRRVKIAPTHPSLPGQAHDNIGMIDPVYGRISGDICSDLERLLAQDIKSSGSFSFCRSYDDAPNPILHINGLGAIGLPLNEREAKAMKERDAPPGTAVDGYWEFDASQVTMKHRAWPVFLDGMMRDICDVMDIGLSRIRPRCNICKVVLLEAGGSMPAQMVNESSDGTFAKGVILLPSESPGGVVCVSHGVLGHEYDCSADSLTNTTVIAWFTGIQPEVKPITNHSNRSAKASNRDKSPSSILSSWKERVRAGACDTPRKILYVFDEQYPGYELGKSALTGRDYHITTLLEDVACPLGFRIGLADWSCRVSYPELDYDGSDWYGDYQETGLEEPETYFGVENLVDLDGNLILRHLDYDGFTAVPADIEDDIREDLEEGPTNELREERRTVLVIWPRTTHLEILHGGVESAFRYACMHMRTSKTSVPTEEETELVEFMLNHAQSLSAHPTAATEAICTAAIRWNDPALWARALDDGTHDDHENMSRLWCTQMADGIKTFGFPRVRTYIEKVFNKSGSSSVVLILLDKLADLTDGPTHSLVPENWIVEQRTKQFRTLKRPTEAMYAFLTLCAVKHGGIEFLEDTVLPQIKKLLNGDSLLQYAVCLFRTNDIPEEHRGRLSQDLLSTAVCEVKFYDVIPYKPKSNKPSVLPPRHIDETTNPEQQYSRQRDRAKLWITSCLDLGADDLVRTLVKKLVSNTPEQPVEVLKSRAREVLLPLIASLSRTISARPDRPIPGLDSLCIFASVTYLKSVDADPKCLKVSQMKQIIYAFLVAGQSRKFVQTVVPRLEALKLDSAQIRTLAVQLGTRRDSFHSVEGELKAALARLVMKFSTTMMEEFREGSADSTLDAVKFCLKFGVPEACPSILDTFLQSMSRQVDAHLVPLIPRLRTLLAEYKQPISSKHFAPIFRRIVLWWAQKFMEIRPTSVDEVSDEVRRVLLTSRWTCSCSHCSEARSFISSPGPRSSQEWHDVEVQTAQHVTRFLRDSAAILACAAFTRATSNRASRRGTGTFTVTIVDRIYVPLRWRHYYAQGRELLDSVSSDPAELQVILGSDYARIMAMLDGKGDPGASQPQPKPQGEASNRSTSLKRLMATHEASSSSRTLDPQRPTKRSKT